MKDVIILNSRAHSFQAGEQLHARSVHSIFPKHQLKCKMRPLATNGNKKRHNLGDKLGNQRHKALEGKQEGRQALRQEGDKADKALGMRTRNPTKGNKKGEKLGDNRGDKLRNKLRHKLRNKGDKASEKTHHPTKGTKKRHNGRQRGRRTQRETRRKTRWETR